MNHLSVYMNNVNSWLKTSWVFILKSVSYRLYFFYYLFVFDKSNLSILKFCLSIPWNSINWRSTWWVLSTRHPSCAKFTGHRHRWRSRWHLREEPRLRSLGILRDRPFRNRKTSMTLKRIEVADQSPTFSSKNFRESSSRDMGADAATSQESPSYIWVFCTTGVRWLQELIDLGITSDEDGGRLRKEIRALLRWVTGPWRTPLR